MKRLNSILLLLTLFALLGTGCSEKNYFENFPEKLIAFLEKRAPKFGSR